MPFSNLTVVSVTGSDNYAETSLYAIIRSCQELPSSKGLLISPTCPENFAKLTDGLNISYRPCKPFGYLEYSIFMLYSLADYIDTDYCLVVQNDGWVLNGKNWKDEFWNYDYIGSPVLQGFNIAYNEQGSPYFKFEEQIYYKVSENKKLEIFNQCLLPQNGGFSLRSKRLLEQPRELGLALSVHAPDHFPINKPYEFKWLEEVPVHNEDLFLSVVTRPQLEKAGIKFAPIEIANQFGFYTMLLPTVTKTPFTDYLGFHFCHKIEITSLNSVNMSFPKEHLNPDETLPNWIVNGLCSAFTERQYNVSIQILDKK